MGESKTFNVCDTSRGIDKVMKALEEFREYSATHENPHADMRVIAIVMTKLEEALLWSYKMIRDIK